MNAEDRKLLISLILIKVLFLISFYYPYCCLLILIHYLYNINNRFIPIYTLGLLSYMIIIINTNFVLIRMQLVWVSYLSLICTETYFTLLICPTERLKSLLVATFSFGIHCYTFCATVENVTRLMLK